MVSQQFVHTIINLGLHMLILFSFLTIFFFLYIAVKETQTIKESINSIIEEQTSSTLLYIDNWDKKLSTDKKGNINWEKIKKASIDLQTKSQNKIPSIVNNNKKLIRNSIIIIITFFLVLLFITLYFTLYKKYDIHLRSIFTENIIIFFFVAIIEFLFFAFIISKYIPIQPDFVATSLIDRIKYHVNKTLST